MHIHQYIKGTIGLALACLVTAAAIANEPKPWQLYFQKPASPIMEYIKNMHDFLLILTTIIAVFVAGLMLYIMIRFRASRNPTPSKTVHNTLLEVVWTMIPVCILIAIGIPSMKILYKVDKAEDAKMTVKAIGHQWYWTYEYPDSKVKFNSYMIKTEDLKPGQIRLLSVDNPIYVPTNTTVRILVTSQDVIHSFAVPALGIKKDGVPGRINETWLRIANEGDYYGQCSELCGKDHGYMPIHVKAVSQEAYQTWLAQQKKPATPTKAG